MVVGGRIEVSVIFDNIFEAEEWLNEEYRGFKKDILLVFRFNNPEDMEKALPAFEGAFIVGQEFFVPMFFVDERFLLEATNIIEKVKAFGGIITKVEVTASKMVEGAKALDDLFDEVRREIELWNFARAMESQPKARV